MRRLWIVFMTVAMVLVVALPATAKRPNKPKPPSAVPIALSVDAVPMWVHEGGDNLRYTVTIDNKTSEDIIGTQQAPITVTFKTDSVTDSEVIPTIPANGRVTIADRFAFLVSDSTEAMACIANDEDCAVSASVELHIGGVLVTDQTMSTPLMPYPPCGFTYRTVDGKHVSDVVTVPVESYDVDLCIWTPPQTGLWEITLTPAPSDNPKRSVSATVSVRDGVPGNWCALAEDASWGFGVRRWRGTPVDIVGEVYLPSDGICLAGGAGGGFFEIGNPASFYLRANGTVATRWVAATP